jgi:uncharacterized protein involved in response to NO
MDYLIKKLEQEPFRIFFPLGVVLLMWGTLLWIPQIWNHSSYPIILHRFLVLNGFTTCFIAGFLMTAAPRFSQTFSARKFEIIALLLIILGGIISGILENEQLVYFFSALQALILLLFLVVRLRFRKANPPFSFLIIPTGFVAWIISSVLCIFNPTDILKMLYYEGVIASIIIGVGCRLIPAILGHQPIQLPSNEIFTTVKKTLISTVPKNFTLVIIIFWISYFITIPYGSYLRAFTVFYICIYFWKIHKKPIIRSALTHCMWFCSWMIVMSFFASAIWSDGHIHATHKFFIGGIVLLCLLVATRVLQAHGAKNPELENSPLLYFITACLFIASVTRMTAIIWPDIYSTHLGYSSILLNVAVILWSYKYIKYTKTFPM